MTALDFMDFATRALSFFNTITLLWLGLTVLLNAERRAWGTWVAGGGLLLGGLFFAGHAAVVGRDLAILGTELNFWRRAVWPVFAGPPFLWYVVIAWYSGALDRRAERVRLAAMAGLGLLALALPLIVYLLPGYGDVVRRLADALPPLGDVPSVLLAYPVFSTLCVVLALAVLRRPGTYDRFMGDLARQRARPWLVAASVALLAVSLAVGAFAAWLIAGLQTGRIDLVAPPTLRLLTGFDLLISALLAGAIVLMGRAIVSYEIFTGKALPRGGLFRHWLGSLLLAAGYGVVVALSLGLPIDPIYRLVLATVLLALCFALLSWRSFVHGEDGIHRLRPFVASQRLYEHLLAPGVPKDDVLEPFRALCAELLGARVGYLAALGPLAPLAGPMLVYPTGAALPASSLTALADRLRGASALCLPLEPAAFGGAVWAVPLWSARGLIGVLLLGAKRDGGLYVQEEIELARAAGERLIDTQAGAGMAHRLMALQRQRMAESQVLDQHARRLLHDDVLPRLHAALLTLGDAGTPATAETIDILADVHRRIAGLLRTMPAPTSPEIARLGLLGALRQSIADELERAFDGVRWTIDPPAEEVARALPPLASEVLFGAAREAARNAARHGRGQEAGRPLRLAVSAAVQDGLRIIVEDDGVGTEMDRTSAGGRGQGLALHGTLMAVVGGTLTVESLPGAGTRVLLALPDAAD